MNSYTNHEEGLILLRNEAYESESLDQAFHRKLVEYFRTYLLVGGMPESVLASDQDTLFQPMQKHPGRHHTDIRR